MKYIPDLAIRVTNISPLAGLFWSNAGFGVLRKLDILNDYEPRYDPTVIPIGDEDNSTTNTPTIYPALGHQSGIFNYGAAYRSEATTPRTVVEALLRLIGKDASKRREFVSINEEEVIAAAKASTERHREGKPIGPLDGIPVAIKGRYSSGFPLCRFRPISVLSQSNKK